jgi:hypothetical protein
MGNLSRTASGGEDAILIMLWRQNYGGTGKNLSLQGYRIVEKVYMKYKYI